MTSTFSRQDAPKFFHVRKVRTGVKTPSQTEIIAGLLPGEVIAAKNSTVIAAQLLKSNLGAGRLGLATVAGDEEINNHGLRGALSC